MKKIFSWIFILLILIGINFYLYNPSAITLSIASSLDKDISILHDHKANIDSWLVNTFSNKEYKQINGFFSNIKDPDMTQEEELSLKTKLIYTFTLNSEFSSISDSFETPKKVNEIITNFTKNALIASTLSFIPLLLISANLGFIGAFAITIIFSVAYVLIILNSQGLIISITPLETALKSADAIMRMSVNTIYLSSSLKVILYDGIIKILMLIITGISLGMLSDRKKNYSLKDYEKLNVDYKTLQAQYTRVTMTEKELRKNVDKITTITSRVTAIQVLSKVLGSALDTDAIFKAVIDNSQKVFKAKKCSIWLLDERKQVLRIKEAFGWKREEAIAQNVALGEGIIGYVAQNGDAVSIAEIKKDYQLTDIAKHSTVPSMICAPLKHGKKIMGVINIEEMDDEKQTSEDIRLLSLLATLTAMAINNARLHAKTVELANTDGLTKLFNNRFFQQFLENEIAKCSKNGQNVSIVMTDIDHFKNFNDVYGHQVGDFVLEETAKVLKQSIRKGDLPARYGGEEFIAVLPNTDVKSAFAIGELIRKNVEAKRYSYKDKDLGVTISVGVATYPIHGKTSKELVKHSDLGLYEAKENGRNQVRIAKMQ